MTFNQHAAAQHENRPSTTKSGYPLIPSPLFVGSPMCGLVLSLPQQSAILALASLATVLAAVAMVPLLIMVCALVLPTKRLWKS